MHSYSKFVFSLFFIFSSPSFAQNNNTSVNNDEQKQQQMLSKQQRQLQMQLRRMELDYDTHYEVKKFYREHEPLDGATVKFIPFRKGSLYGFVNKLTKEWVVEPKFAQVYAVYPEGAIVGEYNKDNESNNHTYGRTDYGVTDYKGNWIVYPYHANLFKKDKVFWGIISGISKINDSELYSSKNLSHIFDKKGKFLYRILANQQRDFILDDTLAWYRSDSVFYIYNKAGKVLKKFTDKESEKFCGIFNNLLVSVSIDTNYRKVYIAKDIKGKKRFQFKSDYVHKMVFKLNDTMYGGFSEEGLHFFTQNGEAYPFGIYNGAVGFGFENMLPYFYSKPYITISNETTEKFGLLSKKGELKLPCKYTYLGDYHNGELAYLDTTKKLIGFMDINGKTTVEPFLSPYNTSRAELGGQELVFQEDYCLTTVGFSKRIGEPLLGYYNRAGKVALTLPDSIVFASHFYDELAAVVGKESRALGFINKKGELVIPMKYSLAVEGAYPFPQIIIPKFINGFAYLKAFKGYIDKDGYEYFSGEFEADHYNFSH